MFIWNERNILDIVGKLISCFAQFDHLILLLPLFGAFFIMILPNFLGRIVILFVGAQTALLTFIWNIVIWYLRSEYIIKGWSPFEYTPLDFEALLHFDNISFFFITLTTFIFIICLLQLKYTLINFDFYQVKFYVICFLLLEFFILNVFFTSNLLWFFFFFEAILIPMLLIISIWGPGSRRIKAMYYFMFYTLIGSIPFLFAILAIYLKVGSLNFFYLFFSELGMDNFQLMIGASIFLSFSIKMPIFPFHLWLPEAHVEAPTTASVILAALLLKLGGYGFVRFLPLFPYAYIYFGPLMYTLGVLSIIYASLITIRQIDLKKIIAYSSIAHMNLCTVGIFSLDYQAIKGSIFLMLSHGLVSSALFFLIGVLYERYNSRYLLYYGGVATSMPVYSFCFLFFSLSNLAFPGTSNFIGELLVLIGISNKNVSLLILTASGMLFSSIYSIWLFNRLCFGTLNTTYISIFEDITLEELKFVISPLIILTIILGLFPNIVLIRLG